MSDIERVPVDMWRNPDQVNRIAAGTIPIGDYEIEPAAERHTFEAYQGETERYDFWGDAPDQTVGRKARGKRATRKSE